MPGPGATVGELTAAIRGGLAHPADLLEAAAAALREADGGAEPVRAFLAVDLAGAARQAEALRARPGWAELPLAGVPVAVKDNLATLGLPTTCGSRLLEGYRSPFEATAVRRLRESGALVVGKTNLDEFAMGSSTEHSAFGPTRNPRDRARVPGGSSGGSAAAVAAGIVPAALGSDTAGSVRQPAAFCGVVGLKPTYGRVSRYGLVAFASSLDHVGVLARTVDDAARVLAAVAGPDPLDSTCTQAPPSAPPDPGGEGLERVVVGVPEEYFPPSLEAGVARACREAVARLRALGAEVREVSLPASPLAVPAYQVIASAEASSNLARFDGIRFGARPPAGGSLDRAYAAARGRFGPEVRRRLVLGAWLLSAGDDDGLLARARAARARVADDFRRCFATGVDLLFTPTTAAPAFRFGERVRDPYRMYLSDAFTVAANLAGLPAVSLPIGESDGLPVGGQLIGRAWGEAGLLRAARALERALAVPR